MKITAQKAKTEKQQPVLKRAVAYNIIVVIIRFLAQFLSGNQEQNKRSYQSGKKYGRYHIGGFHP